MSTIRFTGCTSTTSPHLTTMLAELREIADPLSRASEALAVFICEESV